MFQDHFHYTLYSYRYLMLLGKEMKVGIAYMHASFQFRGSE